MTNFQKHLLQLTYLHEADGDNVMDMVNVLRQRADSMERSLKMKQQEERLNRKRLDNAGT